MLYKYLRIHTQKSISSSFRIYRSMLHRISNGGYVLLLTHILRKTRCASLFGPCSSIDTHTHTLLMYNCCTHAPNERRITGISPKTLRFLVSGTPFCHWTQAGTRLLDTLVTGLNGAQESEMENGFDFLVYMRKVDALEGGGSGMECGRGVKNVWMSMFQCAKTVLIKFH